MIVFILIVDCLDVMRGKLDPLRRAEHAQQNRDPFVRTHSLKNSVSTSERPAAEADAVAAAQVKAPTPLRQVDQSIRAGARLERVDDGVVEPGRGVTL